MSESLSTHEQQLSGNHFELESDGNYPVSGYRNALLFLNANLAALNAFHLKNHLFREGGKTFKDTAHDINSRVIEAIKFSVFFKFEKEILSILGYNDGYSAVEGRLRALLGSPEPKKIVTGVSVTKNDIIISTSTPEGRSGTISLLALTKEAVPKHKDATSLFAEGKGKADIEESMNNDGNVAQSYQYVDKESAYKGYSEMSENEKESLGMDSDGLIFLGVERISGAWFAIFTNPANIAVRVRPDVGNFSTLGFKLDTLRLRKAGLSSEYAGAKSKKGSSASTDLAIAALEAKA